MLFDGVTDAVECDKVVINDREIAFAAVSRLIAQGRRRIALITNDDFSVSRERAQGYREALAVHHIPDDGDLILSLPPGEDVEADIRRFLKGRFMDEVLCVNEICGVIGMGIAQELGFSVPNDIAFIGFTDGILSKYAKPSMTSIAQHGEEMGRIAAEMLISRIEGEPEEGDETFRTEFIESTIIHSESTLG